MNKLFVLLFGAFAAAALLLNVFSCSQSGSGGYQNLGPEATYVGMTSCQSCHKEIHEDYIHTGMGRSLYRPDPANKIEAFGSEASVYDEHSGYHYRPYWSNDKFFIAEYRVSDGDTTHQLIEEIDYVIGSGNQTRSYLIEKNGYVYEAPITWYVEKKIWDLSPGYHGGANSRFNRAVGVECINCHNAYSEHTEGTVNHYKSLPLGIDCERCHGPGSVHVERMKRGELVDVGKEIDYSIVNPAKLPVERQFDVCQQCHLQGANVYHSQNEEKSGFRPAMRLSDVFDVYLPARADQASFGIASHAERLKRSACFQANPEKLTCTTCHDPHKSVHTLQADYFIKQCQSCHGGKGCTAPASERKEKDNDCAACHMPHGGTSDIPHVSFTDHYIRIPQYDATIAGPAAPQSLSDTRAFVELICATCKTENPDAKGKAYLNYYERNVSDPLYLEKALEMLAEESVFARAKVLFYLDRQEEAFDACSLALEATPENTWALFLKGQILEARGQHSEAANAFQKCYGLNARITEAANFAAVNLLKGSGNNPATLAEAERLLKSGLNSKPEDKALLTNLGFIEMNTGRVAAAESRFIRALRQDPKHKPALENLAALYAHTNRRRKADSLLKADSAIPD